MNRRSTAFFTVCLLLASPAAFSCPDKEGHHQCDHDQKHAGQCPDKQHHNWAAQLHLEGDKADQVNALQTQFREQRHALMADHHDQLAKLKAAQKAALTDILSEAELAQWETSQPHHSQHHKPSADGAKQCPEHDKKAHHKTEHKTH